MQSATALMGVIAIMSVVVAVGTETESITMEGSINHLPSKNASREEEQEKQKEYHLPIYASSIAKKTENSTTMDSPTLRNVDKFENSDKKLSLNLTKEGISNNLENSETARTLATLAKFSSVDIAASDNHDNHENNDNSGTKSDRENQRIKINNTIHVNQDVNDEEMSDNRTSDIDKFHYQTEIPLNSSNVDTNAINVTLTNEYQIVDDNSRVSLQVPSPIVEENEADSIERSRKKPDGVKKVAHETGKDSSKPLNNLLNSKSTKAFYEIKPSINTEMERIDLQVTTHRIFILPSVDSAFGKFGPYFVDGEDEQNITARVGSTVQLDCKIGMLGDKKVTWLQHNKDSFRLLTVGRIPYSVDQRISLNFRYPSNWRLQIMYATLRDSGLYKCQVATHPPLVKKINVVVTAPILTVMDDLGRTVSGERHLKAGSALKLRCEARDVLERQNESVIWTRGDETLTEDVSENKTVQITGNTEKVVVVSTLIVEKATPRHAGNYSCMVPGKAKITVAVHVLNGELPAAVHDGNGVSKAVLNLWLIHLTVSYVFSR